MKQRYLIVTGLGSAMAALTLWACGQTSSRPNGGEVDAGSEAEPPLEAAADAGPPVVNISLRCQPQAVLDAGAPRPSSPFSPDACGYDQLANIVDCFFAPQPVVTSCPAADDVAKKNPTCLNCVVTAPDAATNGAIIVEGPVARMNVAGCLGHHVADSRKPGNCREGWEASELCATAACAGCIEGGGSLSDYEACRTQAFSTSCAAHEPIRRGCGAYLQPDAEAAECTTPASFTYQATILATIFCAGDLLKDAAAD